jgi:hypothetical protein
VAADERGLPSSARRQRRGLGFWVQGLAFIGEDVAAVPLDALIKSDDVTMTNR